LFLFGSGFELLTNYGFGAIFDSVFFSTLCDYLISSFLKLLVLVSLESSFFAGGTT